MQDKRPVFFFDIDNCKVHDLMGDLIDKYFQNHLSISKEEANELHTRYYKDYGLAIEGLVRHHKVDPLEYNSQVDDALPLERIMSHNPQLRQFLEDIDKSKVKLWLFTNAYVTHGKRVVKLLGVDDMFEGITYCDYGASTFLCKPSPDMFRKAMKEAGISSTKDCYFVDDSTINAIGATKFGWTAVHFVEPEVQPPSTQAAKYQISNLEELRDIFPQFFKSA
ncbi:hypothetical protein BT93_L4296 [Corymbia citriodora subsp. variegata]|uniref:Pyrimidine 5-nucleotidase n=1 Tax=Corymbia citriodora subsp. variegata TaxID=360336 RepID=A0A8T0CKD4_CORYI|nr:hypothetical protein BT93_L4296 [Corymbia citriodora subsp. variegata]